MSDYWHEILAGMILSCFILILIWPHVSTTVETTITRWAGF